MTRYSNALKLPRPWTHLARVCPPVGRRSRTRFPARSARCRRGRSGEPLSRHTGGWVVNNSTTHRLVITHGETTTAWDTCNSYCDLTGEATGFFIRTVNFKVTTKRL